jgi:phage terminase small subunit
MPRKTFRFQSTFYVRAYELAAQGQTEKMIAVELCVSYDLLKRWKRLRPAFKEALQKGRGTWEARGGLKPKYRRFVEEYLVDLRPGKAAIRAGYHSRTASTTANALLRKPKIQHAIAKEMKKRADKAEIDAGWVVERLRRIAEANMQDLHDEDGNPLPISQVPRDLAYAIKKAKKRVSSHGIDLEYDISNQIAALELLGKYVGMWVEKHEVEHSGTIIELLDVAEREESATIVDADWIRRQAIEYEGDGNGQDESADASTDASAPDRATP